ncbi:hypothetical protein [Streptomyces sp. NPDC059398]|uniref:hypothetical protein n=1 Tax=Streptomyces sp. NPDC059398 TaxID=3346820 RepID=UPI0036A705DB
MFESWRKPERGAEPAPARPPARGSVRTPATGRWAVRTPAARRRAAGLTAAAAVALALVVPGAHAASAASGCPGHQVRAVGFATGQLRVYRTGPYVCAVTLAKHPGARRQMSVELQVRGGRPVSDSGRFTRLAGPVRVRAVHRCVRAVGAVSGKKGASGWFLC